MKTLISAVVCTYNRCASLCETLNSLAAQRLPGEATLEIVVVDNNSADGTKAVVAEAARHSAWSVRYVFEPRQGLSYARNAGIRNAGGMLLAFIDDDVKVEPEWAAALLACFSETGCDAVAGKVNMWWTCPRPHWLADELHGPLISQDLGPQRRPWAERGRWMLGANMAFRRGVFERIGGFREELGRKGDALIGGEDREMSERLLAAGGALYYEPQAVAWHQVDQQRVSQPYLRRWYQDTGRTIGHQMSWKWSYRLTVAPLWVWKQFLAAVARYANGCVRRAALEDAERFAAEMWLRFHAAVLEERFHHWLPPRWARRTCIFTKGSAAS